jgi:hypothetical protein
MSFRAPPLPTEPSIGEIADWAELVALRRGRLQRGKLSTEVERNGGDDRLVTDAWNELLERAGLSGTRWTFIVSSNLLERRSDKPDDHILPAFFAALGLRETIENPHRALFEQCVAELVTGLLPVTLRIGHPRRPPVSSSFREAFEEYAAQIDEDIVELPPSSDNDLKMDVCAWRTFDDGRGGYPHMVGQCATGADWDTKLDELNLDVIADHLNWTVRPMRFFATPHVVAVQHMRRVSRRAGLVLDRPRLLELERTAKLDPATKQEVVEVLADLY